MISEFMQEYEKIWEEVYGEKRQEEIEREIKREMEKERRVWQEKEFTSKMKEAYGASVSANPKTEIALKERLQTILAITQGRGGSVVKGGARDNEETQSNLSAKINADQKTSFKRIGTIENNMGEGVCGEDLTLEIANYEINEEEKQSEFLTNANDVEMLSREHESEGVWYLGEFVQRCWRLWEGSLKS